MPLRSPELRQKSDIVLVERPQVIDPVLEHGHARQAHAEREARHDLRVVTHGPEHVGVHHSRAADLDPAAASAQAAGPGGHLPPAVAQVAGRVDLGRRLREGEVAGAQADAQARTEEPMHEVQQRPLELGEGDLAIDQKPLHLGEHRRVGRVVVAAEHVAGSDDPNRRRARQHRADLNRRGV